MGGGGEGPSVPTDSSPGLADDVTLIGLAVRLFDFALPLAHSKTSISDPSSKNSATVSREKPM